MKPSLNETHDPGPDKLKFAVDCIKRNWHTDAQMHIIFDARNSSTSKRKEMFDLAIWCLSGRANRCVDQEIKTIETFIATGGIE